jgi:hypothetical protein
VHADNYSKIRNNEFQIHLIILKIYIKYKYDVAFGLWPRRITRASAHSVLRLSHDTASDYFGNFDRGSAPERLTRFRTGTIETHA